MKIIDLLNKIANGEEVTKKIKYKGHIYQYQYKDTKEANIINYYHSEETHHHLIDGGWHDIRLNDEVEILEETPKISKLYINNELQYNLEEEKKIPEKINTSFAISVVNCAYKINEIIDYLKSKGDE